MDVRYKKCQFCHEDILDSALVCKHCQKEQLTEAQINGLGYTIASKNKSMHILGCFLLGFIVWPLSILAFIGLFVIYHFSRNRIIEEMSILQLFNEAKTIQRRKKNRNRTLLISIVVLGLTLFLTNPSKNDFKEFIKDHIKSTISEKTGLNSSAIDYIVDKISSMLPSDLDYLIEEKNLYLISFYSISLPTLDGEKQEMVFIGVGKNFIPIK